MADHPDITIDYDQEAKLLLHLFAIHPGPWACGVCRQQITPETGWKPIVVMIFTETGVWRSIVDIRCGNGICKETPFVYG